MNGRSFTVDELLDGATCSAVVAQAESHGFRDKSRGQVFAGNRLRATFTDQDLADLIWKQLAPHCGNHLHCADAKNYSFVGRVSTVPTGQYVPMGVNPFMRVSKYLPGQSFREHTDTAYAEGQHYVGFYTLLLYLNEDVQGGETAVFEPIGSRVVTPETGKGLVFYHYTPHEGAVVTAGTKYVLRTEVMFSLQG